ncbi:hypothetical protein OVA10_16550 [Lelliottia sp. SL45]|uniref:hypothetical protein n=1 Tax=Lelliottia sp. SL45 TaxID=2994665 RepID=UPI00227273E5|nr:hypothetical protein [Lelliottia sp. SL45]MCY1699655.1 hypothetical protein [Lelliottia sp. SL45]
MITGFGNNVVSALAADITANQTTIQVMPGAGEAFARLLTYDYQNASNDLRVYAKITLTDAGETEFEVCHLTAVNNDILTVTRGQEGTTAKGWSLNDVVANFATRGSENQFVQIEHLQSGHYTSGVAGGTANALTLDLPASYFLNGSTSWELRTLLVVYPIANNTGPSTLQLTMGGRPLGTFKLYKGNRAELTANDILKDVGLVCVLDKTKAFFNVSNPGAIYAGLGTAAFRDIVTSPTDTTAGRVLTTGWEGLGLSAEFKMGSVSQFLAYSGASPEVPLNGAGWQAAYTPQRRAQAFIGGDTKFYSRFSTSADVLDSATPWAAHYTTENKPAATDVDAVSASQGGTFQKSVTFNQGLTSKGQVAWGDYAHNVGDVSYNAMVNIYDAGGKMRWAFGPYKGGWSVYCYDPMGAYVANLLNIDYTSKNATFAGEVIPGSYANFDARYMGKSNAYTKTESDARYVTGVQFGAVIQVNAESYTAPAGHVLVGVVAHNGNYDTQIDAFKAKPIQRQINNQWVTIPG